MAMTAAVKDELSRITVTRPSARRADGRRVVVLVDDFCGVETRGAEEAQRFGEVTARGSQRVSGDDHG